ncbi:MAG: PDZ domain-containing protein [Gemmatimonadales bacterium]|nr:PDZ domain-containing protein [Gemmatimonadales bacterium]
MRSALALAFLAAAPLAAQAPAVSAPVGGIRYEVRFDAATAKERSLAVTMRFDVKGSGPILLSLPAWTPGAYEISDFAKKLLRFTPTADGRALAWDKLDYDTWRIQPAGAKAVEVTYLVRADSLDNAQAWSQPDFAFFNGTTAFLYPEGRCCAFAASVTFRTEAGWQVATGMRATGDGRFGEANYHDLVDMPTFIGRFDIDSQQVAGKWLRLATYPQGVLAGAQRSGTWESLSRMVPPMGKAFGEVPWETYTVLVVGDTAYPGASGLEHQNSHLDIINTRGFASDFWPSLLAHEIVHAWNVKRIRPADLFPYRYERPQQTPWLWVSEGITDYYADLVLVRGGVTTTQQFLEATTEKIGSVDAVPPVALEDASLETWIRPVDGTALIYYPKGSLAGLLLDILIRDGSDNRRGLDDVMRALYTGAWKKGRGFTADEWWKSVSQMAGGRSFAEFNAKYIDGREPYPWESVLPLAGLRYRADSIREARIGIQVQPGEDGVRIMGVQPGSMAADAGIEQGDVLLRLGEVEVKDPTFGGAYRQRYATADGTEIPVVVRRGGREVTLKGTVRTAVRVVRQVVSDQGATPKAARIREGILSGRTD